MFYRRSTLNNTYEGWLTKQSFFFKMWNKRWFVLKGLTLYYYFSPNSKMKGIISLDNSKVEIDKESKRKASFKITIPHKIYHLSADTEEEANSWIYAIYCANSQNMSKISLYDFDILSLLGRGSLGKVKLARHRRTNKLYALKSISKYKLESFHLVFQTLIEKKVLTSISHPFIVSAKFTFQTDSHLFIVMDFVSGGELLKQLEIEGERDYTDKTPISQIKKIEQPNCNSILLYDNYSYGGFTLKRVRLYAAQLFMAIQFLHSNGYIHRDLKPSNILIDTDGYLKLIDFGFVKEKMFSGFAETTTFCGTPLYAAPEIIREKPYGRAVDWWSFGVIIYEMIFNETPFSSENLNTLLKMIVEEEISFPSNFTIEGQIPYVVIDFLSKLLEKDPHKRLGTYDEEEIIDHPFFEGIEWKKLFNKIVPMDWKPMIKNNDDFTNFFDDFTKEEIQDSVFEPFLIANETLEAFSDFTYVDENEILTGI